MDAYLVSVSLWSLMLTRYWRKAERSLEARGADPDKVTWTRFHDPLFGRHKERLTGCVELFMTGPAGKWANGKYFVMGLL